MAQQLPFDGIEGSSVYIKPSGTPDYAQFPDGYSANSVRVTNFGGRLFKIAFSQEKRDANERDLTVLPNTSVIFYKSESDVWINFFGPFGDTEAYVELGVGGI